MRILNLLRLRLRSLFRARQADEELDSEVRFHLLAVALLAAWIPARRAARLIQWLH